MPNSLVVAKKLVFVSLLQGIADTMADLEGLGLFEGISCTWPTRATPIKQLPLRRQAVKIQILLGGREDGEEWDALSSNHSDQQGMP